MISEEEKIVFLPNPKLNPDKLDYLREDTKDVYANLFEIKLLKNLQLYQYPFSVFPDVGEGDYRIRNQLFRAELEKFMENAVYQEILYME